MITEILGSLNAIAISQFYSDERSFQGEFLAEIRSRLPRAAGPNDPIVQQEYQKTIPNHGIRIRPDLIFHVPTQEGKDRQRGNFVAFELKRRASIGAAREAFRSLDTIIEALNYELGVFINVDSNDTYAEVYEGKNSSRLHCFATSLEHGTPRVAHSCWDGGILVRRAQQQVPADGPASGASPLRQGRG